MKALCWNGVRNVKAETVKDPEIINPKDVILKVALSSMCGSDLHFINGYIPAMKAGDILGHEFVGEVVETGPDVKTLKRGDRVVVASDIGCGDCYFCMNGQWSLCDNSNQNGYLQEEVLGYPTAAFFGCSHLYGGYAGSHAEYIRVPYADRGCFKIPEGLTWEKALFCSDAFPTGYMAADMAVQPGDIVAVWGAGGVGQMAMISAWLKGASRVIAIDRFDYRLAMAARHARAEVYDYDDSDIPEVLRETTGGRGPDVCIDAVGLEAKSSGVEGVYDKVKQKVRLHTDRPSVLRQTITVCRKGGTVSVVGVYAGLVDKFPIGAFMNKALTLKAGHMHGQKYIPHLLGLISKGAADPSYLMTHKWSLQQGPEGYRMFNDKTDDCMRGVFVP
jgi:threonine dehydrogenase-like Zn-dependent dehydrogenase